MTTMVVILDVLKKSDVLNKWDEQIDKHIYSNMLEYFFIKWAAYGMENAKDQSKGMIDV